MQESEYSNVWEHNLLCHLGHRGKLVQNSLFFAQRGHSARCAPSEDAPVSDWRVIAAPPGLCKSALGFMDDRRPAHSKRAQRRQHRSTGFHNQSNMTWKRHGNPQLPTEPASPSPEGCQDMSTRVVLSSAPKVRTESENAISKGTAVPHRHVCLWGKRGGGICPVWAPFGSIALSPSLKVCFHRTPLSFSPSTVLLLRDMANGCASQPSSSSTPLPGTTAN